MSASIWNPAPTDLETLTICDSIAELREIVGIERVRRAMFTVFVSGYYTRGDGGGGYYYLDPADTTSADDGGAIIVADDGYRWKLINTNYMSPKQFGCKGDGVTDDTVKFKNFLAALPIRGVGDLCGANYFISAPMAISNIFVTLQNGKFTLADIDDQFFYVVTARDFCRFYNLWFQGTGAIGTALTPKYRGGIFSGNIDYPAPMNVAVCSHVTIEDCHFDDLTIAAFVGGSSAETPPRGWIIQNNRVTDMVGYPGQSEGYGFLFSPANDGRIHGNYFQNIRRHAIYTASEASRNTISENLIDGCDNIAIQHNTNNVLYGYADGNKYINNEIRGLTRSIAYGYMSSIGIGLYGKHINTIVSGNRIYGALDVGIHSSGDMSGTTYADNEYIFDNLISMDATATDSGIRVDGTKGASVRNNKIRLAGAIYGIVYGAAVTADSAVVDLSSNTIDTTVAGATAFRIDLQVARTLRMFDNILNGFTDAYANVVSNTSIAGSIFTDLNNRVVSVNSDADFSVNFQGAATNDSQNILHTGTLTAARTVTLAERSGALDCGRDAEVTVTRTGGGAFNLNIKSTSGGTLKALTTGQWAKFKKSSANVWVLVAFGAL